MGQQLPIGTLVGTLQPGHVGVDLVVDELAAASTITRVFLSRTDYAAGDVVVASLRNAPGGAGDGIEVVLGDGQAYGSASGALAIAPGGKVYLWIASAGLGSANLSGSFELEEAAPATPAVTVPIGTLVGSLAGGYAGSDVVVAELARTSTITRVFLRRTDHGAGDVVVAQLRNAPSGAGDGIEVTLADGEAYASAVGALAVAAGGRVYLRVVSSGPGSMNLSGSFEIAEATSVLPYLTTLQRVKQWLHMEADWSKDAILTQLIAGVSARCQAEMGRRIVATAIVAELHEGDGRSDCLQLEEWPIVVPPAVEVRHLGEVVPAEEYRVLVNRGWLVRAKNGGSTPWPVGRLGLEVDYTAGYTAVPEDLAQAATQQVAFDYRLTAHGGNRLGERGTILDLGGSAQFITGPWAPGVREALHAHRSWRAG